MQKKKIPKWTRAVLQKRPDSIISSDFSNYIPLKPAYEKEDISMFKLLAMDYARDWHKEKDKRKAVVVVSNEAAFLQRRYVIRGLFRKQQEVSQPEKRFIMKRFKNIPSRFKKKNEEKGFTTKVEEIPKETKLAEGLEDSKSLKPRAELLDKPSKEENADDGKRGNKRKSELDDGDATTPHVDKEEPMIEKIKPPAPPSEQKSNLSKHEGEICVCNCNCYCVSFRNEHKRQKFHKSTGDTNANLSRTSSALSEYKSISRDSIDDKINPDSMKCPLKNKSKND